MARKSFPLSKVYTLLESGPVIMVTTAREDKQNVMPMSWHTMMEFEPPLVGFVMSDLNYSFNLLKATGECVINIPTVKIAKQMFACGKLHGDKINKLEKFGLTSKPASVVRAPLINECYANFECRVVDTRMVAKYGFFVVEVVKAWIDPSVKNPQTLHHIGKENFMIAGKRIRLKAEMK
ncbi:MAG TPA: flavin reductase family protein [Smithella sp.]|nr:flavin reductase family protein [Smithella sp.]HNY50661.1 flavin reductase family protein [Smithella sp.]HOG89116.1 flavin reductase family protein [Smithella sp.]HOU50236.1 flavin reductase family protein [Smithella sp.]HQG65812.1 flavin reductase family protein [Smithella sp.]